METDFYLPVVVLKFPENRGLGAVLAEGILACNCQLVARVDTDDINLPHRFEKQHSAFLEGPKLSLVGGQMEEIYANDGGETSLLRSVPLATAEINSSSRYRNPINHPTVMFHRNDIIDVGNYQTMLCFEDYYLWIRLIMAGYSIINLDDILVETKVDSDYFGRRGGANYFKMEYRLANKFREIGFQTKFQSIEFLASRILFRIVPVRLRYWMYSRFLRIRKGR
jgi:hypothetical protein